MSKMMNAFSSILVDIDVTATAQPALERAAEIARRCGALLRVVDVMSAPPEAPGRLPADVEDEFMRQRRERLARIAYGVRGVVVESDILSGMPADTLIADVERYGHDLLVRSHTRDIAARGPKPFGPVDVQLFRRCRCPVWAVGAGAHPLHPKVVGAIDVNTDDPLKRDLNRRVIEVASLLAKLQDGSLILLHAWQPFAERKVVGQASVDEYLMYLDSTRRRAKEHLVLLAESFGNRLAGAQFELRRGALEDVLPAFVVAEGIDIVVVGTIGRTGILRQLRGNRAEQLLDRLPCSMVAVKPVPSMSPLKAEVRARECR